jgi:hypothetical protein
VRLRLTWCFVAALAASDCANSGQDGYCDEVQSRCLDDATIEICRDGHWSTQSCDAICTSSSRAHVGCLRRAGDDDECLCGPADGTCEEERVGLCASSGAQWDCGAGVYYHRPCHALCQADTPVPVGCYYDLGAGREGCHCAEEGAACTNEAAPRCAGQSEIARCVDGMWQIQSCSDECGSEAACEHDDTHQQGACLCLPE